MLGRLGDLELAVSNIVLAIEMLAFLPMVGFHIGNATLVGQAIGRGRPEEGVYSTASALHITLTYMTFLAVTFVFVPEPLLSLFKAKSHGLAQYGEIMDLGVILMRFVAVFCFFDALKRPEKIDSGRTGCCQIFTAFLNMLKSNACIGIITYFLQCNNHTVSCGNSDSGSASYSEGFYRFKKLLNISTPDFLKLIRQQSGSGQTEKGPSRR